MDISKYILILGMIFEIAGLIAIFRGSTEFLLVSLYLGIGFLLILIAVINDKKYNLKEI